MGEKAKIKDQLIQKLKTISQDPDFILSVINAAWHIDDRKKIIAFIDDGKDVTYESIILLALTLYEEREEN